MVFLQLFPALTGWENVCRAYGASNRGKDGPTEAEVRSGRGKPRRYTNAGLSGRGRTAKTAKDPPLQTAEEGHDVSDCYETRAKERLKRCSEFRSVAFLF